MQGREEGGTERGGEESQSYVALQICSSLARSRARGLEIYEEGAEEEDEDEEDEDDYEEGQIRSVGQGKLTFSIKVDRATDRSQSKRNGSKNEIDDGRRYSNQFGRFLADQKSTFIISYILNFPQT